MKVNHCAASSLDAYIAREDDDASWLEELDGSPEEAGYTASTQLSRHVSWVKNPMNGSSAFSAWPEGDKPARVCSAKKIAPMKECNVQAARRVSR